MTVDFRRQEHSPGKTIIHNNEVEIVSKYKYGGTIFDDKLKWDDNTEEIVKKGQQQLYLLQKLNYFSVDQKILTLFYKSFIESVVILFHLLVSQLGSEEQEQPAKNCPYRLQDNCSAPERPGSFLWTADLTESLLYFNEEGSYFKPGIYYSPIRSSS